MDAKMDCYIKYHPHDFPEIDSSIKSYVKDFPEPVASLVYHYKAARNIIEDEIGGVISHDSSRKFFEPLEKILEPLINYCAKLVAKGPATQNAVCRSGLRSLSAADRVRPHRTRTAAAGRGPV